MHGPKFLKSLFNENHSPAANYMGPLTCTCHVVAISLQGTESRRTNKHKCETGEREEYNGSEFVLFNLTSLTLKIWNLILCSNFIKYQEDNKISKEQVIDMTFVSQFVRCFGNFDNAIIKGEIHLHIVIKMLNSNHVIFAIKITEED